MNTAKYCTMRRPKAKRLPASGGFPLDPLTRALPLDPAGGSAPDPRHRLAPALKISWCPTKICPGPTWPQVLYWRRRCNRYFSLSRPSKGTSLGESASFKVYIVKIRPLVFTVGDHKKKESQVDYISP